MKRILVTGGSGFIGSHTCLVLLQKGYEIIVLDSCVNSSPKSLEKVLEIVKNLGYNSDEKLTFIKGDLRDIQTLENIFNDSKLANKHIDGVIHFAGLKAVGESVKLPLIYWDSNVIGTINLLKVMESNNCRKIVFSSSATIYGKTINIALDENTPVKAVNPYGNTKVVIERLLNDLFDASNRKWRIANLRYFNPIGAHSSGLIGEAPLGIPNNIFPFITQVATGQRRELNIFGNDWPTPDGTGIRDYIHVMDLAEGHISALEYLCKEEPQVLNLNLGTGKGTSVLELVDVFQKVNKIKINYVFVARREGDSPVVIADNTLAISRLDWRPKRSLEDMCRDGWNWQYMNPKGYS